MGSAISCFFIALLRFVVSLVMVGHLILVDTLRLCLEVDMVGVDIVEDFGNTLAVLVVQDIAVAVVALKRRSFPWLWLQVVLQ